jgi:CdiI immunity protein
MTTSNLSRDQYERLCDFFGLWFHPEWADETASADEDIEAFLRATPDPTARKQLSEDLGALLALGFGEEELFAYIDGRIGCYYDPRANDQMVGDWVRDIIARLRVGGRADA